MTTPSPAENRMLPQDDVVETPLSPASVGVEGATPANTPVGPVLPPPIQGVPEAEAAAIAEAAAAAGVVVRTNVAMVPNPSTIHHVQQAPEIVVTNQAAAFGTQVVPPALDATAAKPKAAKKTAKTSLVLPHKSSQQGNIRSFLENLPEEHFMFWCHAVEEERQARMQRRAVPSKKGEVAVPPPAPTDEEGKPARIHRHELNWTLRYQELVDYRIKHGHVDVPDEGLPPLSKWVQSQRQQYKRRLKGIKSSMTDERETKLRNVGFKFSIKDDFDTRLGQLLEFKQIWGHTRVPQHYAEHNKLGTWVKGQRAAYRFLKFGGPKSTNHCKLTEERIQRLDEIGFEWVVKKREVHHG